MQKALISLSGGMDSAVVLAEALHEGLDCACVGFHYGSKHNAYEIEAAKELSAHYKVPYHLVDLTTVMGASPSSLTSKDSPIPEGHFEAESMRQTVVPARNIIFASILAGIAMSNKIHEVRIGVHAGDHFIYPDCRPEFVAAMAQAILTGTDKAVRLVAPFGLIDKAEILRRGLRLSVPFVLTRTCYKAQRVACGRCGSCQERLASFAALGETDPLTYESRELLPR